MQLVTVLELRLKVGSIVTEEQLSALQLAGEKQTALDKALTHISASMKTERDIRDFLRRKGYLQDVADYVVEKMKGYGYLDDEAYARAYAGEAVLAKYLRGKSLDEKTLRKAYTHLLSKGFDYDTARAALARLREGSDEEDRDT